VPTTAGEQPDPQGAAYERRTLQLHEARAALAEVVSALRLELEERRQEAANLEKHNTSLTTDNQALREYAENLAAEHRELLEHAQNLTDELRNLRTRVESLEAELSSAGERIGQLQSMKVVRWTARPRRMVGRLRHRRR
jgi:predicted nuclease with TOPRIM domain